MPFELSINIEGLDTLFDLHILKLEKDLLNFTFFDLKNEIRGQTGIDFAFLFLEGESEEKTWITGEKYFLSSSIILDLDLAVNHVRVPQTKFRAVTIQETEGQELAADHVVANRKDYVVIEGSKDHSNKGKVVAYYRSADEQNYSSQSFKFMSRMLNVVDIDEGCSPKRFPMMPLNFDIYCLGVKSSATTEILMVCNIEVLRAYFEKVIKATVGRAKLIPQIIKLRASHTSKSTREVVEACFRIMTRSLSMADLLPGKTCHQDKKYQVAAVSSIAKAPHFTYWLDSRNR